MASVLCRRVASSRSAPRRRSASCCGCATRYGLSQNVVEDLVLGTRSAVLAGAHDSLARQALEDALRVLLVHRRIASEIPGAVGDLRSRRDEVVGASLRRRPSRRASAAIARSR